MAFNIEIKGLRELQARFRELPKEVHSEAKGYVSLGAQTWVRNAKRDAPINLGLLRQQITYSDQSKAGQISFEVVSGARYSAYIEWGTITKVSVPGELSEYAMNFKGKGIRKNGGIIARPFFFKQRAQAIKIIEEGLERMTKAIKI